MILSLTLLLVLFVVLLRALHARAQRRHDAERAAYLRRLRRAVADAEHPPTINPDTTTRLP